LIKTGFPEVFMAECSRCGKQSMSFTCRYCGEKFCSEHRLPENHDCEGLESGKKKEFSDSGTEKQDQKWFDDKFSDKKGKRSREKQFEKPGFLNESKRILKSNITLLIIGITGLSFMLHEAFPAFKNFLQLSPALTDAAVQATNQAVQEAIPGAEDILDKTLAESPWTLFTIMLVHANLFHFLANMITFYFFGTAVEKTAGGLEMLKMYLVAGLSASIVYVVFRNILYQVHGPVTGYISLAPAVGASGAVIAMFAVVAMLYPEAEVLVYFIFPMKIKTAFRAFAGLEILNLVAITAGISLPVIGGFASSAHLAGLAVGLYYGKKLQKKYKQRTSVFNPLGV
jgi:membrane associated rhomboid family serine protease